MLRISKESILMLLKFVANIEQKSHFLRCKGYTFKGFLYQLTAKSAGPM